MASDALLLLAILAPIAPAQCLDQRLVAAPGTACSRLGDHVASDGDFVIASEAGAFCSTAERRVRIFRSDAGQWVREPIQGSFQSGFALQAVDLQGNWAVVGEAISNRVVVFERRMPGGQPAWVELAQLSPPTPPDPLDLMGASVALDGNLTAIGAPRRDSATGTDVGTVYIFHWDGFAWVHESTISPAGGMTDAFFGFDIDLVGDRLVVGAPGDSFSGSRSGRVQIYKRRVTMFITSWVLETTIGAPDPAPGDLFGSVVSYDGSFLAVGTQLKDSPLTDAGAVYVYRRNGTTWTFEDKIVPLDLDFDDRFGASVSIETTTTPFLSVKLLVGAPHQGQISSMTGAAYLFNRVEILGGGVVWGQQAKFVERPEMSNLFFGSSVALDRASQRMVVGATGDLDPQGRDSGAVYVYSFSTVDSDGDGVPDPCDLCPGFDDTIDVNGNGIPDGCECFGDANGDGIVNFDDITAALASWGALYAPGSGPGDANIDGTVDFDDILSVLANWLRVCP